MIEDDNIKNQHDIKTEELNDICDECKKVDESVTQNLILTGFKKDVSNFFNRSDFFIHTPIFPDPLPTVIFESILHDVPVISTQEVVSCCSALTLPNV